VEFDAAESKDTIIFHNTVDPKSGSSRFSGGSPAFDIGVNTIKVKKGTSEAPFTITIVGEREPVIQGASPGLLTQNPEDCGIFYIGPWCSVEISGLNLQHKIPPYAADAKAGHGSATIANLVDNAQISYLHISNCKIDTNATAAISLRSDSKSLSGEPWPVRENNRDFRISGCTVTGRPNLPVNPDPTTFYYAGNFSSVNLGYWGKMPLDMARSKFEVSDCTFDSLFLGVAVWNVRSDASSTFLVKGNNIGMGIEGQPGTAMGVSFIGKQVPIVLPKGTIDILDNKMRIGRYLKPLSEAGAVGVLVRVNEGPQTTVTIKSNTIEMALPKPDTPPKYAGGIVYEQISTGDEQGSQAQGATTTIKGNAVCPLIRADTFERTKSGARKAG
jgi:hypothetical protein